MNQKPIKSTLPPWTLQDTFAAYRDGWGLFEQDNGTVAIQRLDDPASCPPEANVTDTEPQFDCDENALAHVKQQAAGPLGNPLHKRALALIEQTTVPEPLMADPTNGEDSSY